MLKRTLVFISVLIICISCAVSAFAAEAQTLEIDLKGKLIEVPAYVWEGELFLPLRGVLEELGFDVEFHGDIREISISKPGKTIKMSLNDSGIKVGDYEAYITGGCRNVDGRTYLGQNFFSDNFGLKIMWDKANAKVRLQELQVNPIVISTRREESETKSLKLTIQYPELQGLDNADVQNKLNSLFAGLAAEAKNKGKEAEKYIVQDQINRGIKAEVYFNYQVKYNQNGLLSIVFSDYQYSGGAHGLTVQSCYTFDLKTGAAYKLKDLFKANSDYVSLISSEVKKQMEERGMTVLLAPFDSIKAEQDYYLSNNAVVVYFQAYEYLPYAYGIPEFAVEFPGLKEWLKPELKFLNTSVHSDDRSVPAGVFRTVGTYEIKDGKVVFDFELINDSNEAKQLKFGSGQQFEVTISDEKGEEVYRYSDGKFFTLALLYKNINPGESLKWQDEWNMTNKEGEKLTSGKYRAVINVLVISEEQDEIIEESQLTAVMNFSLTDTAPYKDSNNAQWH